MNREIMFRAWDDEQKKMFMPTFSGIITDKYYGNKFVCELANGESRSCGESSILMMNTGLKDKNGIEIYEGDIIEGDSGFKYDVRFGEWDGCIGFYVDTKSALGEYPIASDNYNGINSAIKVIGNIYENPELLK